MKRAVALRWVGFGGPRLQLGIFCPNLGYHVNVPSNVSRDCLSLTGYCELGEEHVVASL